MSNASTMRTMALAALFTAAGCSELESSTVSTKKLRAEIELRAWSDGSAAMGVALKTRKPWRRWVMLDDGDSLVAHHDDDARAMYEEQLRRKHTYVAWFDEVAVGDEVWVELIRGDEDDAARSTASLPPPFEMSVSDTSLDMGWEDLEVVWYPSSDDPADQIVIDVSGSCINNFSKTVNDNGRYTIRAGEFEPWDDESPDSCTGDIEVRRERVGELDEAFAGGWSKGVQIRATTVWLESFFYTDF